MIVRPESASLDIDCFVRVDPAVEILALPGREGAILCHHELEMGMAVPPGEGLVELIGSLKEVSIPLRDLLASYDDAALVRELLERLFCNGFLLVGRNHTVRPGELAQMRAAARSRRSAVARPLVRIDLDRGPLSELPRSTAGPFDLELTCTRLSDHGAALATLAAARRTGELALHSVAIACEGTAADNTMLRSLVKLGATVIATAPVQSFGQAAPKDLVRIIQGLVPVSVLLQPGSAIFDERYAEIAVDWIRRHHIGGIRLEIIPSALWPDGNPQDQDFAALFARLDALSGLIGDVTVCGMPDDAVLCGAAAPRDPPELREPSAETLRMAYLRWRLIALAEQASSNLWSQTPRAEALFVRPEIDLLPNRPDLLRLRNGSVLLDVCGGIGRVARRLTPSVGPDGLVVSVEMNPVLVDRARHFALAGCGSNIQFRVGLAQRIPLPDASFDAAVNEWTGAVWELGLGPAMVAEMARVVKPGGRVGVTHRLLQLDLSQLNRPWVQIPKIRDWVRDAYAQAGLRIISERIWGQAVPSLAGEHATDWHEQFLVPVVDPFDYRFEPGTDTARADVYLTMIGERQDANRQVQSVIAG